MTEPRQADQPASPNAAVGPSEFARPTHPGDLTPFLAHLLAGGTLSEDRAAAAFDAIMTGQATEAEIGALLALLATRLPTVDELTGAARVMRAKVDRLDTGVPPDDLLDTAGTGGAPKTFNVSTAAAIIAAGSGAKVAKHGNRSRTGRGSAEVLDGLGVNVDADRAVQQRCVREANVCFCFAIHHHPAARHAMPVRKALGVPTIFNLLGPLTNPAGAARQVMGVYRPEFVRPIAETFARLGAVHALVVHGTQPDGKQGLDEFALDAPTLVAEVRRNGSTVEIREYEVDPVALDLQSAPIEDLAARDLAHAIALVRDVLRGDERGPARDLVLLNAAAALVAAGQAPTIEEGIGVAAQTIDFGDAWRTLETLIDASRARA